MVGVVIGNYQIIRKLGEGGMGAVYLGQHTLLGRRAAIKVLLPDLSARPDIVNRFFNEARAVTSISDPGIVQVFDFGYHSDGSAFIVMEFLDGEPLDRRLARFGRLTVAEALRLCRQLASSLAAAHAQRIIHRDLKPENIFLVPDAEVASGERSKILDFGIAKLSDEHPGKLKTSTGMLMGTPVYMSPEQCRGLPDIDHRSDIYSLGCVLFQLLTGRPPFEGEGPGDIISAHIREPAPLPSTRAPGILPAVDALMMRFLAKAPAERFQTMTEVSAAIAQVLAQVTSGAPVNVTPVHYMPTTKVVTGPPAPGGAFASNTVARPPTGPTTLGASAGQFATGAGRQRRIGLWIAGGLVVAAAGVGIAIVGSHGSKDAQVASADSTAAAGSPGAAGAGSPGAAGSPNAGAGSPNAGAVAGSPNAAGGSPNAGAVAGSQNAAGGSPNAVGGSPNAAAVAGSPSAGAVGGSPNAAGGSPNAVGGSPNAGAVAGSPNAVAGSPNAVGGSPNAGAGSPSAGAGAVAGSPIAAAGSPGTSGTSPRAVDLRSDARSRAKHGKLPPKGKAAEAKLAAETPPPAAAAAAPAPPPPAPEVKAEPAAAKDTAGAKPGHGAAAPGKPAASKCSKAAFAAVYNAAAPTREQVQGALGVLRECHQSGAVNDDDFNQTRDALVARLMAKS